MRGMDLSDVAVRKAAEEAARAGLSNATFRCMNAESLDFPDASFDVVFGKGIIHHLDLDRTFRAVRREHLESGGPDVCRACDLPRKDSPLWITKLA